MKSDQRLEFGVWHWLWVPPSLNTQSLAMSSHSNSIVWMTIRNICMNAESILESSIQQRDEYMPDIVPIIQLDRATAHSGHCLSLVHPCTWDAELDLMP